jgi:hypothetical protein
MDTTTLLLGLLFSSIGMGYFIYGKRQSNAVIRYTGVALIVFPYVFDQPLHIVVVGTALLFVPRFVKL